MISFIHCSSTVKASITQNDIICNTYQSQIALLKETMHMLFETRENLNTCYLFQNNVDAILYPVIVISLLRQDKYAKPNFCADTSLQLHYGVPASGEQTTKIYMTLLHSDR